MEINCIIIEDEPLAQEKLEGFIKMIPSLSLKASFDNAINAMVFLKENKIDLVFLDIQMQKLTGIQFLESLKERPHVIIVSAYDQYALKSYEFSVTDYLLKPYSFERFLQAINKVTKNISSTKNLTSGSLEVEDEILFVKTGSKIEKVELKNILYIQGMRDYQMIVSHASKIMTLQTFREIENVLPEPYFVRIHKSYIIAVKKIDSIEKNRIKIADQRLPISETYKEHFYNILLKCKHLM